MMTEIKTWIIENPTLVVSLYLALSLLIALTKRWYNHYVLYQKGYTKEKVKDIISNEEHEEFPGISSVVYFLFWFFILSGYVIHYVFSILDRVINRSAKEAADVNQTKK